MKKLKYVGIDLHRHYSSIVILDEEGVKNETLKVKNQDVEELKQIFSSDNEYEVVVESTYGWYWLADVLSTLDNVRMKLANAKLVKKMSNPEKKTDKVDAAFLANLSRVNMLPEIHMTSKMMREVKEILRARFYLVNQRSNLKTKVRDLLAKQNLVCPADDIGSKKAKEWIRNNVTQYPYTEIAESFIESIERLDKSILPYDKKLREYEKFFEKSKLLKTIPGVGIITAVTLLAEIDDIKRFPNAERLCSYAGLVPKVSNSGGKTYYGRLKEGNTYIKSVLGEASMTAIRKDKWLKMKYEQMKVKKNAKSAKVVVMRKLLVAVYHVLSKEEPYKAIQVND